MDINEIYNGLSALTKEQLLSVESKIQELLSDIDKKTTDIPKAIQLGDQICDLLNLKAFPYSIAYQIDYNTTPWVDDVDPFENMDDETGINWDNIDEADKLIAEFCKCLSKEYFCKESDGQGRVYDSYYKIYRKGGEFDCCIGIDSDDFRV